MVGSSPHQTSPHHAKSANVRQQDEFLNLEHERDRQNYQEGSVHSIHTDRSGFRRNINVSHERDNNKTMQQEINDLKMQLCRTQRSSPLLALMSPPMTKKILYTDRGLELHQVNPSPVKKNILIEGNAGVVLVRE